MTAVARADQWDWLADLKADRSATLKVVGLVAKTAVCLVAKTAPRLVASRVESLAALWAGHSAKNWAARTVSMRAACWAVWLVDRLVAYSVAKMAARSAE
jgi:hypothetical protein